jgi:hypothetical protein
MTRSADEPNNQSAPPPLQTHESSGSTRREFAKSLAALAAIPLLGTGKARAGTEAAPPVAANPLTMAPAELQAQPSEKPLPEAEALAEVARIQYGKNLNEEQMAEIKRSLSGRFRAAEAMKKTKLANGDEPAFIFSANP